MYEDSLTTPAISIQPSFASAFARGKQEDQARADFSSSSSAMAAVVVLNRGS
jgi:hypothetical protein